MCWTFFAYRRNEKWLKNVVEVEGRGHLEDLGLDGRIIMQ
jgi:hypothetical protein